MEIALHTASMMHTNVATDLRVAEDAGYDGVELWMPKVSRYLDSGFEAAELAGSLGRLRVTMLDVLLSIERTDPDFRRALRERCGRMSALAAQLGCPAVQVVALDEFDAADWAGMRRALVASLNELAEIAAPHGVRLALEPVSFSPFHALDHALEVVSEVGADRVGLVLDTWHLWTGGVPWEKVADLDDELVVCAHIGDSNPRAGVQWSDEDRTALPGDGIVPLAEGIDAIRSTGYDGVWSVELLSRRHWEWDPTVLAKELFESARKLLVEVAA